MEYNLALKLLLLSLLALVAPNVNAASIVLGNKTIDVPFQQTCMAARMDYVSRYRDCAYQRIDSLQHYQRYGHANGAIWKGELCTISPVYQNETRCQCQAAINTFLQDTVGVTPANAFQHYLNFVETTAKPWHCEKCLMERSDSCILARRDYAVRYLHGFYDNKTSSYQEPAFHYYTWGIQLGYTWNASLCYPSNLSLVVYPDSTVVNCDAAKFWYEAQNPNYKDLANGGAPTAFDHYTRYLMEYGAYWNVSLCVDVENECLTGNNNCNPISEVCNNTVGEIGSYTCACVDGWSGKSPYCTDTDECKYNNVVCDANSRCVNTPGSYYCECKPGYTNITATTCGDMDECALGIDTCPNGALCKNTIGDYTCDCPVGYGFDAAGHTCIYDCQFPALKCKDGRCIMPNDTHATCAAQNLCIFPAMYQCYNNSCGSDVSICAFTNNITTTCQGVRCWDDSCVSSEDACPTLPECPQRLKRCHNGECNATCSPVECVAPKQWCTNGLCSENCTKNWNGCPRHIPYLCPTGRCVADVGKCGAGGYDVPRTRRAIETSTIFRGIQSNVQNFSLTILSGESILIAKIEISDVLLGMGEAQIVVKPTPDSIAYEAGYGVWGQNFDPGCKIFSGPFEIVTTGNINFRLPATVYFYSALNPANLTSYCLALINTTSGLWECHSPLTPKSPFIMAPIGRFGKIAIIEAPPEAEPIVKSSVARERTVGIYLFSIFVVLFCAGLIFASLRDRKIFIEIVAETIRRESNAAMGGPYASPYRAESQAAPVPEPVVVVDKQIEMETKRKEMAKRGMSMPAISLPDDVRARHMSRTKHAVVIRQDLPFTPLSRDQPADYISGDRAHRAVTYDSPFMAYQAAQSGTFNAHPIPPYSHRTHRAGSAVDRDPRDPPAHIATAPLPSLHIVLPGGRARSGTNPHDSRNPVPAPEAKRAHISDLIHTAPAPDLRNSNELRMSNDGADLRTLYSSSRAVKKSNRNIIINPVPTILNPSSSSSSLMTTDTDDKYASEMEEISSFKLESDSPIPSPTPLVPRIGSNSTLSRIGSTSNITTLGGARSPNEQHPRRLEWEMSVRVNMNNEVDVKKMSLWQLMKLKHTWISVWFTERTYRLTCVEQLTILFCMVMGNLGISAPFFHNASEFDISKSITVAISTASLVWVVTIGLTILFQNAKKTSHTLAVFGLAFAFCCMCIVLTMVYSYYFVLDGTKMWVLAFGLACLQDVLVNQPFKVLVIALIYGCLPRGHRLVNLL